MIRLLLIGCLSFLMIGCTQFRQAQEPSSGDTARLRGIGSIFVFPSNCRRVDKLKGGALISGGLASSGYKGRSIGMPETEYSKNTKYHGEMFIRADEPITVSFSTGNNRSSCTVNGAFSPEINHDYEVRGYISGRTCYLHVSNITNGQEIPVQLSKKRLRCPAK